MGSQVKFEESEFGDGWLRLNAETVKHEEEPCKIEEVEGSEAEFSDHEEEIQDDQSPPGNHGGHLSPTGCRNYYSLPAEAFADAEVSDEASSRCRFACLVCGKAFQEYRSMQCHWVSKTRHRPKNEEQYLESVSKAVMYKCPVCPERLLCDRGLIFRHLHTRHMLNLDKMEAFGHANFGKVLEHCKSTQEIEDRCTFTCPSCQVVFGSWSDMHSHGRRSSCKKLETILDPVKTVLACLDSAVSHICYLCESKMICDRYFIRCHAVIRHGISLQDYRNKQDKDRIDLSKVSSEIGNKCVFQCEVCRQEFDSYKKLAKHWQKSPQHKPDKSGKLTRFASKVVAYVCNLCGKKVLCDRQVILQHQRELHNVKITEVELAKKKEMFESMQTTRKFGSFCTFRCPKCELLCENLYHLRRHSAKCPLAKSKETFSSSFDCLVEATSHQCNECDTMVLCDPRTIGQHVKRVHGLTLAAYRKRLDRHFESPLQTLARILESAEESKEIGHLCLYLCHACNETFNKAEFIVHHWLTSDACRRTKKKDHSFPYKCVTKAVKYVCPLCSGEMLCDKYFIASHARSKHGITLGKLSVEAGDRDIGVKETLQRLAEQHPFSKIVGNFCKFKCPKCDYTHNAWSSIQNHFAVSGHGEGRSSHHVWLKCLTSKIYLYRCEVCYTIMLCDRRLILYHVKRHVNTKGKKLTPNFVLQKYFEMAGLEHEWHNKEPRDIMLAKAPITSVVGDSCEFTCSKCGKVHKSWTKMQKHLLTCCPGQAVNGFFQKERYLTTCVGFQCPLCRRNFLCDKTIISGHLHKHHHGASLKNLAAKSRGFTNSQALKAICFSEYRGSLKGIPSIEPLGRASVAAGGIPKAKLTQNIGNLSEFACLLCREEFLSWRSLKHHYRLRHGQNALAYDKNLVTRARYHECVLCRRAVLCDDHFVLAHAKYGHGLSPAEYREKVCERGGRVFPTFAKMYKELQFGKKSSEDGTANQVGLKLKPCRVVCRRLILPQG